jgi:excinuclease UvrABC nuclease subunit
MFNYDLKDKWGIYKITNTKNNTTYIGKSVDIYKRWNEHVSKLKDGIHHCPHLQAEFNQYGLAAFEFSVIEYVKRNLTELYFREQDNIFNYDGELLNVYCSKDKEIYELAKLLKEERIPFTLKTKMDHNTFDIVVYRDDECCYVKTIIDVFDETNQTEERLAQIKFTVDKHNRYCLDAGIKYLDIEPDDCWFSREDVIDFIRSGK